MSRFKLSCTFIVTLFSRLYALVSILLTYRKHLDGSIISLNPANFYWNALPFQKNYQSCVCVFGVSMLPLSAILLFVFGTCVFFNLVFFRYHRDSFVHLIWHLITPAHSFTLQLFDTKCYIFLLWLTHLFTHVILKSTPFPIGLCVLRNVIYYVIIFCQVGLQMKGVLIIEE